MVLKLRDYTGICMGYGKDKCDPTPANEALCGKINFELWAKT